MEDANLAIVIGRLIGPTEITTHDSGAVVARYLLNVHTTSPTSRTDLIPVAQCDPPSEASTYPSGTRLKAVGSIQRRQWQVATGGRTKLEFVAQSVEVVND